MAAAHDPKHDEALVQFLSMTEDRVDPDVARSLLEAVDWNVQAAVEQLFGDAGHSRPATGAGLGGAGGAAHAAGGADDFAFADAMSVDDDLVGDDALPAHRRSGASRSPAAGGADGGVDAAAAALGAAGAAIGALVGAGSAALGAAGAAAFGPGGAAGAAGAGGARDHMMDQETGDAHLAAAIEASYRDQTHEGREQSEEELLAQALRLSQQEEDTRQRQALRDQQEAELQESILMDRMREEQEQVRMAAERAAEQERESAAQVAEQQRRDAEVRAAAELEAKRARLPAEPPAGEPGRLAVLFRLPGGQRVQRAFRSSDTLGTLYDFVDLQSEDLASRSYRLVQTMPRMTYEDRKQTLSEAGIQNQCALMVEVSQAS